jgi:hypothetical protein
MEVLEHPPHAACAVGPFMLSRCGRGTYIERGSGFAVCPGVASRMGPHGVAATPGALGMAKGKA